MGDDDDDHMSDDDDDHMGDDDQGQVMGVYGDLMETCLLSSSPWLWKL